MNQKEIFFNNKTLDTLPKYAKITWQSPSNIAIIKYWGKSEVQTPKNSNLSFSLSNCYTETTVEFNKKTKDTKHIEFDFYFENKEKKEFYPKLKTYFSKIIGYLPYLKKYYLTINSHNSFPHSSGIASSASSMSALSLCLLNFSENQNKYHFLKKASFLSRIGSGSACRSIYGKFSIWGKHNKFTKSNDLFAIPLKNIHPIFHNLNDTILIIESEQKKISSSLGHDLMNKHPFSNQRIEIAKQHMSKISEILNQGDLYAFGQLVEKEALMLHALMLTSNPYFILIKPNTLQIIEKIWDFRNTQKIPVFFTLDAGANIHLIYTKKNENLIRKFIKKELLQYCENQRFIEDYIGNGPKLISIKND